MTRVPPSDDMPELEGPLGFSVGDILLVVLAIPIGLAIGLTICRLT